MPKIPETLQYSTFYLYHSREDAEAGRSLGGTGFFVGYPTVMPKREFLYAVTNWHVSVRAGASVIRINKIAGGVDIIETDPSEWFFEPKGPDIAIFDMANVPVVEGGHEITAISWHMMLEEPNVQILGIGPGDDIFMVGRFMDHDGGPRNVPALRFGNISVMPQLIEQPTGAKHVGSFILDVHSRTGFSGSPVFVYRTVGSDLSMGTLMLSPKAAFIYLLGAHWGQFPEEWQLKTKKAVLPAHTTNITEEQVVSGLSGMSLAVPCWEIMQMLRNVRFQPHRDAANAVLKEAMSGSAVAESAVPSEPGIESNRDQRENFMRLAGVAAKRRIQDHET